MIELTTRESEIILLVAKGYSSLEIADELYISKGTVETHRRNIMQKLGTNKLARAIVLAIHHKIIEIDDDSEVRLCLS
jgi:DNA-binding NarL/FixJ family response regulator